MKCEYCGDDVPKRYRASGYLKNKMVRLSVCVGCVDFINDHTDRGEDIPPPEKG